MARLSKSEYAAYLKTPAWKRKAAMVHAHAKHLCEGCGLHKSQEVHHLTYANIGNEFLFELVAICALCHDRIHGKAVSSALLNSPIAKLSA